MKKQLSICLAILLVFSSFPLAYADEFTLHSGTMFGMTMEEVSSIEKAKGYEVKETTARYMFIDKEDGQFYSSPTPVLKIAGSMAGVPDSTLSYFFENDKLIAVLYEFPNRKETHDGIVSCHIYNDFDDIQKSLEKKYTVKWNYTETTGLSEFVLLLREKTLGSAQGTIAKIASSEYPIDEKGIVYINHAIMYTNMDEYSKEEYVMVTGSHYLEYRYESFESQKESNEAIAEREKREQEEKLQKQQEQEAERENDL